VTRKHILIESEEQLKDLANYLSGKDVVAFDWETRGLEFWTDDFEALGLALSADPELGYYIPINHRLPDTGSLFGTGGQAVLSETVPSISIELIKKYIYPILLEKQIVAHNLKFDAQICDRVDLPIWQALREGHAYDTYLAAAVTNNTRSDLGLKDLTREWLGIQAKEITELNKDADLTEVDVYLVAKYAADDACNALALKKFTEDKLAKSKRLSDVFWKLEMPIIEAVARMEMRGVVIDKAGLRKTDEWAVHQINCAIKKMRKIAGFPFNPNKTEHVTTMLYDKLGLQPALIKGKDATDRKQIEIHFDLLEKDRKKELAPFVKAYLAYKDAYKVHTSFTDTLIDLSYKSRIHPTFWQVRARSGRMSSMKPNAQQFPKVLGPLEVRKNILPDKGYVFITSDYFSMEYLIIASISQDELLLKGARDPSFDIHKHTARSIFKLSPDTEPEKKQRDQAKTTNYSAIFGITPKGLAKKLSMTLRDAESTLRSFDTTYAGLKKWKDDMYAFILNNGYAETYFGRRRYGDPEKLWKTDNRAVKEAELRQLANTNIQGTGADVVKYAIKYCQQDILEKELKTFIVMQVHDELVFLTPYEEIDTVVDIVKARMPFTLYPGKPNEMLLPIDIEIKPSLSKSKSARISDDILEKYAPRTLAWMKSL